MRRPTAVEFVSALPLVAGLALWLLFFCSALGLPAMRLLPEFWIASLLLWAVGVVFSGLQMRREFDSGTVRRSLIDLRQMSLYERCFGFVFTLIVALALGWFGAALFDYLSGWRQAHPQMVATDLLLAPALLVAGALSFRFYVRELRERLRRPHPVTLHRRGTKRLVTPRA